MFSREGRNTGFRGKLPENAAHAAAWIYDLLYGIVYSLGVVTSV